MLYRLAWVEDRLGQRAAAIKHYSEALNLAQQRNVWFEGAILNRLGRIHAEMGNLQEGQALCERGWNRCKAANADECEAEARINLGSIARDLGRLSDARSQFEQALQIFRSKHNLSGQAAALDALGQAQLILGDKEEA